MIDTRELLRLCESKIAYWENWQTKTLRSAPLTVDQQENLKLFRALKSLLTDRQARSKSEYKRLSALGADDKRELLRKADLLINAVVNKGGDDPLPPAQMNAIEDVATALKSLLTDREGH